MADDKNNLPSCMHRVGRAPEKVELVPTVVFTEVWQKFQNNISSTLRGDTK